MSKQVNCKKCGKSFEDCYYHVSICTTCLIIMTKKQHINNFKLNQRGFTKLKREWT